jgi:RNA polymerase sigma-70 factor, ECF subfamily
MSPALPEIAREVERPCSMVASRMESKGGGIAASDVERLRIHLSRAVAHVCPRMLSQRREDLVQDSLLKVIELVRRREGDAPLSSSYLHKVAYSALIDEIRRVRRRQETPIEDGQAQPVAESGNPERAVRGREIGRGILECLACLARERRRLVTLYLQGHSVLEAARILDLNPKKTENLTYRGLADLRECLAAKGMKP